MLLQQRSDARFRTPDRIGQFDAVVRALTDRTETTPLLIIVEDIHTADPASLLLLQFMVPLLQGTRLFVVATSRSVPGVSDTNMMRTLAQAGTSSLTIEGFDLDGIAQFIALTSSLTPTAELASILLERTDGNPFLLSHLVPGLEGYEDPAQEARARLAPSGARSAAERQLESLTPECRAVLNVASVAGQPFDVGIVASAAGLPLPRTTELLDEAVKHGLVLVDDRRFGSYCFRHLLVCDALYSALPVAERARLHGTVGRATETAHHAALDDHLATLAYHFVAASPTGDVEKAVDYSVQAGAQALRHLAFEDATRHFESALRTLELIGSNDEASRCAILLDLATAQIRMGDVRTARATFEKAANLARRIGSSDSLARTALAMTPGVYAIEVAAPDSYLIEILEEALLALEGDAISLRALLMSRLALALYYTDQCVRKRRLVEAAAALLYQLDPTERAQVALMNNAALWEPGELERRERGAVEALALSRAAGDKELVHMALVYRAVVAMERGDVDTYDAVAAEFFTVVDALKQPHNEGAVLGVKASIAHREGRLDEAMELAQRAYSIGMRFEDRNVVQGAALQIAFVQIEQDRAFDVVQMMRRALAQNPGVPGWRIALTHALCAAGEIAAARTELEPLLGTGFTVPKDVVWLTVRAFLAEIAVILGERGLAAQIYDELFPYRDQCIFVGYGTALFGSTHRYLGQLATLLGDFSAADSHLRRAVEVNGTLKAPALLAYAQHDLATLQRVRTDTPDPAFAKKLDEEVLEVAARLGFRRLERIVRESLGS